MKSQVLRSISVVALALSRRVGAFQLSVQPNPSWQESRRSSPGRWNGGLLFGSKLQESPTNQKHQTIHNCLFRELCHNVGAQPANLLDLKTDEEEGVRGVHVNRPLQAGDVVLSLPLEACIRDDDAPEWFAQVTSGEEAGNYAGGQWATRLAASVVDRQLFNSDKATELWLSLLPNPDFLRASLPVHWSSRVIQSARSTALELATDAAFFTRAEAVQDLLDSVKNQPEAARRLSEPEMRRLCENALDLVQTRSCRGTHHSTEDETREELLGRAAGFDPPLRLLAPVFDFINHGSHGSANAFFGLEEQDDGKDRFVIRALRDIAEEEQVFIDYGESARPAWKCLASYGFVPAVPPNDWGGDEEEHAAEVYVNGVRYEVGPSSIPEDMVAAAVMDSASPSKEDLLPSVVQQQQSSAAAAVEFTPDIAIRLGRRITDAAFHLLLDPRELEEDPEEASAADILSAKLAASLRWYQHRVLMACSLGLRDWAVENSDAPRTQ